MRIDYSQINTFQTCRRKFENKYILALRKVKYDFRNIDLEFGKVGHSCLEMYYKGMAWADIKKPIENLQDLESNKCKTGANLKRVMEQYIPYYSRQDKGWQILEIETPVSFMIGDLEWILKPDMIIRDRDNYYVVDNKFTGTKKKATYFQQFEPSTQVSGNTTYCQQKYGQCSGFIANVIFVGYRERKYKGEEAGFHCEFERAIINRYPQQLEDFKLNVVDVAQQIEGCKITNYWSKTQGNCMYCEFKELCFSYDDEQIRNTLYEVVENPLDYLKTQEVENVS